MKMNNVHYGVIDSTGRLRIPRSVFKECEIESGDVVKVITSNKTISIYKIGILDNRKANAEEVMSIIMNSLFSLDKNGQLELLKKIADNIKGSN